MVPTPGLSVSPSFAGPDSGSALVLTSSDAQLPAWFETVAAEAWNAALEYTNGTPLSVGQQRMVVEVPATYEAFKTAMGVSDDGLRSQAALTWVTTTPVTDNWVEVSAPRVVVNPLWSDALQPQDREAALLVLTHEAVHVATGVRPSAEGRLWVAEGVAEYVALTVDAPALAASEQLVASLCSAELRLPSDEDFRTSELAYDLSALLVKLALETDDYTTLKLWWDGAGTPQVTLAPLFTAWCES
ncbi:MAG: hypothetical protein LBM94_01010 [Propionibacteriaceae bacterium]|nr:hypothetical protein [Propionibacteriaceae bacterium]